MQETPTIQLTIPAEPGFLRLARLTAADVGTRVGLTFEEIDDLRIAVDELCFVVVDGATGRELRLAFRLGPDEIEVEGSCDVGAGAAPVSPSELAGTIVRAVVDDFTVTNGDGERRFRLRKRITAHA